MPRIKKCICCHHEYKRLGSFGGSGIGAEDLDKRQPRRYDFADLGIDECKNCGYVADDLSAFAIVNKLFLRSKKYKTCQGLNFKSKMAERYYKRYLLIRSWGIFCSISDCYDLLLRAAWSCDDDHDSEPAVICRRKALKYLRIMILFTFIPKEKEELILIQSDIMRRARLFDEVIKKYDGMSFRNRLYTDTVKFQVALAKKHDDQCYRFSQVPTKESVSYVNWMA